MRSTGDSTEREYNSILLNPYRKKATNKRFSSWTDDDKLLLIELYANNSNKDISKILNKTKASIDKKAHLLGLKKSEHYRKKISLLNNKKKRQSWSDEETIFIKSNYNKKSYEDIAIALGRTPNAVSQKARQLKLQKYARRKSL